MKTSFAYRILAFIVLATPILSSAKSFDREDSWLILNKVTHKRSYIIETRDRKCVLGMITGVTTDSITAKVYASSASASPDTVIFPRADILSVAAASWTGYYSGRSSWSDVSS